MNTEHIRGEDLSCNEDEFIETVVELARENSELLAELSPRQRRKFVRLAVEGSRVAFAVWQEGNTIHLYCLKGRDILGTGRAGNTTAIVVKSMLDAIGIANDYGDGAPHLAHTMPGAIL